MLPGEDVAKNLQNLIGLAKLFINAIARSSSKLPLYVFFFNFNFRKKFKRLTCNYRQLHEICNFMYKIVGERYPGSERIAVGGFMFLRFLCPAIVAPEAYGLVGGTLIPLSSLPLFLCFLSLNPYASFLNPFHTLFPLF